MPERFKQWVRDNSERIEAARQRGSAPYFVKDNEKTINSIFEEKTTAIAEQNPQMPPQYAELEKALGVKRGAPMTFDEANEMRGNPHFAESEAYRNNCQTCVVANELRRRGFPVEALPNLKGSMLEKLSMHPEMAWIDAEGNTPTPLQFGVKEVTKRSKYGLTYKTHKSIYATRKEMVEALEQSLTEDGRYHISFSWENTSAGHIITLERINGELRYYDPQSGKIIKNFGAYLNGNGMLKDSGLKILRVDNLLPNSEVCGKVLTKSGSKAISGEAGSGGIGAVRKEVKKEAKAKALKWASTLSSSPSKNGFSSNQTIVNNITIRGKKFINETFAKNINSDELPLVMEVATRVSDWITRGKRVRTEQGKHHSCLFNVYEAKYNGRIIEYKTMAIQGEPLYTMRLK